MARPRNPKSTVRTTATSTMAWPACGRLLNDISVLGLVGGGRADDDVVGGQLLDQRGERNEVVANGHLQRRMVMRRVGRAARSVCVRPHLAAGRVRERRRQRLGG